MSARSARANAALALAGAIAVSACGRGEGPSTASFTKPAPTVARLYQGLSPEAWAARLSDADPAARYEATVALAALDAAKEEGRAGLLRCLSDPSASVRFGALDALGRVADPDATLVLAALGRLDDEGDGVRRHAKAVAARWGALSLPALRARIAAKDERTRRDALEVLAALGADAAPAAADLALLVVGDDVAAQDDAAQALAAMGAAGVPALALALDDPRADTAVIAASALARVGPAAAPAVPALARALRRRGAVRSASADALVAVGEPAREALVAAAADSDEGVREAAKDALDRLPAK